jgi:phosphate-selective porin OprO/OprP
VTGGAEHLDTVAARLFAAPTGGRIAGLGIGVAATVGNREEPPSAYRTIGHQTFWRPRQGVVADGEAARLAGLVDYFHGPFGLLCEYIVSRQELRLGAATGEVEHRAWNLTMTWVLTGEDATFDGVEPGHDVDFNGTWGSRVPGAWQLVARATGLDVDDDSFPVFADPMQSSSRATTLGIGLHWIVDTRIRLTLDYNATELAGGALDDEHVAIARVQLRF